MFDYDYNKIIKKKNSILNFDSRHVAYRSNIINTRRALLQVISRLKQLALSSKDSYYIVQSHWDFLGRLNVDI